VQSLAPKSQIYDNNSLAFDGQKEPKITKTKSLYENILRKSPRDGQMFEGCGNFFYMITQLAKKNYFMDSAKFPKVTSIFSHLHLTQKFCL